MPKHYKAKYIISKSDKIFENSIISIKDGKILDISNVSDNCEITDFGNAVISPGFVNLHAHLQYSFPMPPHKTEFSDWIISLIKQYYFLSKEKKIEFFKAGLKEAILSGCTCIAQLSGEDFFPEIIDNTEIKSFVFLETFSNSEERTKKEIKKLKKLIKENTYKNVTLGISPHSPYNVHRSLWEEISKLATEEDILVHTHLAESQDELNWLAGKPSEIDKIHMLSFLSKHKPYKTGLNPVEYLEKTGILNKNLIAAHCIQLDEKSLEKLVNYGVKIAHCPRSNMLLHEKTLDFSKLPEYIRKNTGLGTDSRASNYDLSVINEAKYIKDSGNLEFEKIFDMMTINSARILKLDDKIGTLENNKDADFIVFKLEENESYQDILNKQKPDEIYVKGELLTL